MWKKQSPFLSVSKKDKNEGKIILLGYLYYIKTSSSLWCPDVWSNSAVHFKEGKKKKVYGFFVVADFFHLLKQ